MARFVLLSLLILLQISSIMAVSKMQLMQITSKPESPSMAPTPGESNTGDEQHIRLVSRHHNVPMGGDVILGGFACALVAAIVCYIRVTRKHTNDNIILSAESK